MKLTFEQKMNIRNELKKRGLLQAIKKGVEEEAEAERKRKEGEGEEETGEKEEEEEEDE